MTADFRISKAGSRCQFADLKRVTCCQHYLVTALLKLPDDWLEKRHMRGVIQINPNSAVTKHSILS